MLELDFWQIFVSLDRIQNHTFDTLLHQSLSIISNALNYLATSAIFKK